MADLPARPLGAASQVSRLALGCAGLSGVARPEDLDEQAIARGVAAVAAAFAAGVTFYDFADIYGHGTAEMVWNQACRAIPGLRAAAVVCTKASVRRAAGATPYHYNASAFHLTAALEGSLRRLGADRVDLLLIHRPDPLTHPRETAAALGALVRAGLVGAVGVSNHTPAQVRALVRYLEVPLVASQPSFSLLNLQPLEDGTLDVCEELDLLPMAYSPLGRGVLVGGHRPTQGDAGPSRLEALASELQGCASAHGCTAGQVALAWLLAHPAAVVPVVGSRDPEHIREAAGACGVRLSREEWYRLWVAARGAGIP